MIKYPGNPTGLSAIKRHVVLLLVMLSMFSAAASESETPKKYEFYVNNYMPEYGDEWAMNRLCWKIMRNNKDIVIKARGANSNSRMPGGGKILSFAGEVAPDILLSHFWAIRQDIQNGFLCPLNEYIGYDGFYGLNPATNKPDEKTGTRKMRKDPATGKMVADVNGIVDDDEALWPEWRTYPKIMRLVCSARGSLKQGPDGKPYEGALVYGTPQAFQTYYGIAYRRDLFANAGLTDNDIPTTWDEFYRVCQRLTNPLAVVAGAKFQRGQRAFLLPTASWQWLIWLYSSGGDCILQSKTNPKTKHQHWYKMEETDFIDPETGESLALEPSSWKAVFANEAGESSLALFHKLCWGPWLVDPETAKPVDLTAKDAEAGQVMNPITGKTLAFDSKKEVIEGVVRHANDSDVSLVDLFARGEVAMAMVDMNRLEEYRVNPNNMGFFAIPGSSAGNAVVGYYRHYNALNYTLAGEKNKERRDRAWKILSFISSSEARRDEIENKIFKGYARFLTPEQLRSAGREEYMNQLPEYWKNNYSKVTANARTEPFIGNWGSVSLQLERKVLSVLTTDRKSDYAGELKTVEREANDRLMFGLPEEVRQKYRPLAWSLVAVAGVMFVLGLVFIVRSYMDKSESSDAKSATTRSVFNIVVPLLMLSPAVLSILLWAYYPLIRGSSMVFQDVNIIGNSKWIGMDNFITVFFSPNFYIYLRKTLKYSALSIGLSFLTPILVAILLSEVPRCKTIFRTVYFLPQVSSGLVILFIWKLMYNPTEFGMLNQLLLAANKLPFAVAMSIKAAFLLAVGTAVYLIVNFVIRCRAADSRKAIILRSAIVLGFATILLALLFSGRLYDIACWTFKPFEFRIQNWLGDKSWAMIAVILPGVWANAGIGSLIYLAALKSIDDDAYEASEIDGCSFWDKLVFITIPYLKPLIIINFIGAFIGTFHTMGNIFAMTGGGPGDETMVLSLAIWYEAFAFMQFGTATAMAWTLGLLLIGFTVYQLRILKKVDFRQAPTA